PVPITDALGLINGVDLAVTYAVAVGDADYAVSAITLQTGASVTAAGLTEAMAHLPVGLAPDVVHVVGDLALSATYRPTAGALQHDGIPKPGRNAWYLDAESGQYNRLTAAIRTAILGTS
ncbi:MAG TPA: acyl-CoA synthetase, partial [Mycobacterium sp.]|nr:acyl-CoA synthetase [Mycobacterium sp.]